MKSLFFRRSFVNFHTPGPFLDSAIISSKEMMLWLDLYLFHILKFFCYR